VRARLITVLAVLLVLTACSSPSSGNGEVAVDRIVVANGIGEIYLVDSDGADRVDLVEAGIVGLQPVWSPDGQRIAWSQREGLDYSIASANPDGTDLRQAETPFSGYFGFWDPTSSQLGFLGNAPPGTGLVLDAGAGASTQVVDSDTFYYFSWNPDGTRWIVHSGSGLHLMKDGEARQEIDLADGPFRAPIWAPDGEILLVIANEGRNDVVSYDAASDTFEVLVTVGDIANMVLDDSGRYLAIESIDFDGEGVDTGDAVQVAFQTPQPAAEVLIYDRQTGTLEQAHDGRSGGFWWSPDGRALAMLVPEDSATPEFAQWLVWTRDGSFRTDRFVPSRAYVTSYVPFFDQYAQAVTPWSPDSQEFVYAGTDAQGQAGVFVQQAEAGVAARLIMVEDNAVAFWSRT